MIEVGISAPSLPKLRERFAQAPAVVAREMAKGLRESAEHLRFEVAIRTRERTGRLRAGWQVRMTGSGARLNASLTNAVPYAGYVERGTRPHVIRPRFAKALRFSIRGQTVFAKSVNHPGTRGRRMLAQGAQAAQPRIVRIMAAHLGNVTKFLAKGGSG